MRSPQGDACGWVNQEGISVIRLGMWLRRVNRCKPTRPEWWAGLMKTGTGSAIRCIYASAQALLVAVPVPLFISPVVGCLSRKGTGTFFNDPSKLSKSAADRSYAPKKATV